MIYPPENLWLEDDSFPFSDGPLSGDVRSFSGGGTLSFRSLFDYHGKLGDPG